MERRFFDSPRNARARSGAAEQPSGDKDEKYMVAAGDCDVPGAIWWTRRGVCGENGQGWGAGGGAAQILTPPVNVSRV